MADIRSKATPRAMQTLERPCAEKRASSVQALSRAMILLEALSRKEEGSRLRDLCLSTGLPPSTVHRLLTTMQDRGFVSFEPEGALWHVGSTCLAVGSAFLRRRRFVGCAEGHVAALSARLGAAVNLGVLDEQRDVILLRRASVGRLLAPPKGGSLRVPWYASGVGKVLHAALSPTERQRLVRGETFKRFTENTIVQTDSLAKELETVVERGYAVDDAEARRGKYCVAVPIFDELSRCVAAISVTTESGRQFRTMLPNWVAELQSTADLVTGRLGGYAPREA